MSIHYIDFAGTGIAAHACNNTQCWRDDRCQLRTQPCSACSTPVGLWHCWQSLSASTYHMHVLTLCVTDLSARLSHGSMAYTVFWTIHALDTRPAVPAAGLRPPSTGRVEPPFYQSNGRPRATTRSSCTPSMSLTSPKGTSVLTAAQLSELGIASTTLIGGKPGARHAASWVCSCSSQSMAAVRPAERDEACQEHPCVRTATLLSGAAQQAARSTRVPAV